MSPPPTSALQAKITAFEALSRPVSAPTHGARAVSPQNILERPISPPLSSFSPITPSAPSSPTKFAQPSFTTSSPSPSPPNLGRRTSLIDLKDWVLDDGASTHTNGTGVGHPVRQSKYPPPPLINLDSDSPPTQPVSAPPLPPRKPSDSSLQSASASANSSSSSLARSPSPSSAPLQVPAPRPLLSKPGGTHTYPPTATLGITVPRGHAPASSISSFHSVSLSSDGDPSREHDSPIIDLADDFERVSVASSSPSLLRAHEWPPTQPQTQTKPQTPPQSQPLPRAGAPPRLPQRPPSAKSPPQSRVPSGSNTPKQPPPPPPTRARQQVPTRASPAPSTSASASTSDRSSIRSSGGSTASSHAHPLALSPVPQEKARAMLLAAQLARPTPVPPAARRRYEVLFAANVRAQPRVQSPPPGARRRQAAGWRGLSVDLITSPRLGSGAGGEGEEEPEEERLGGDVVKRIWGLSRLGRGTLRAIWSECDPDGKGALDCAAFVRGMWRIDEELRRAQVVSLGRHASAAARGAPTPPRLPSRASSSATARSNVVLR